ncbi:MAG: TetR/AcrR family transcriptional regulator [Planctomycetota bacterium]
MTDMPDMQASKHRSGPVRSSAAHEAVLRAAGELVAKRGYLKVTMQAIADQAGVGKQTVYRWWPSKAAVFMELYVSLSEQHVNPSDTGSFSGDLKSLWGQLLEMFQTTPAGQIFAGLIADAQSDSRAAQSFRQDFLVDRRDSMRAIVDRAVSRGEVARELDTETVIDLIAGPVFYRLLVEHEPLSQSFLDETINVVAHGISRSTDP